MKDTEREIERTRRYLEWLVRVLFSARFPANEKRRDLDHLDADGDK